MMDRAEKEPHLDAGRGVAQAEEVPPEAEEILCARAEVAAKPSQPMVTEIRVQLTKEPPILAFVAITLWDVFVVHDLRVLQRHDGSRVVLMPRLQAPDGKWSTIAHPIREPARLAIEEAVLRAFEEEAARPRPLLEANG
jgi:stage V sporulation protein G